MKSIFFVYFFFSLSCVFILPALLSFSSSSESSKRSSIRPAYSKHLKQVSTSHPARPACLNCSGCFPITHPTATAGAELPHRYQNPATNSKHFSKLTTSILAKLSIFGNEGPGFSARFFRTKRRSACAKCSVSLREWVWTD